MSRLVPSSTSSGHISARKTPQQLIRTLLEIPHRQRSNGAPMSYRGVVHTDTWSLEVQGETEGTHYNVPKKILYFVPHVSPSTSPPLRRSSGHRWKALTLSFPTCPEELLGRLARRGVTAWQYTSTFATLISQRQ